MDNEPESKVVAGPLPSSENAQSRSIQGRRLAEYDALLDRFMPPGFLVDHTGALREIFGAAEQFVRRPGSHPSIQLWDVLGLAKTSPLAQAVLLTIDDGRPRLVEEALREGEPAKQLSVEPLGESGVTNMVLVVLEPEKTESGGSQELLGGLSRELVAAKTEIDRLDAQLRTSTEELQSVNEELVVSNEELRKSNEELHGVNSELATLNREKRVTIQQLRQATSDFRGLLRGSNVGAIFLGRDFDIRLFTSTAADFFGLIPEDLGRSLGDFSTRCDDVDLAALLEDARDRGQRFSGEVRSRTGLAYLLDVSRADQQNEDLFTHEVVEFSGEDTPLEGIVVTLVDLRQLVEARAESERLAALVESSTELIASLNFDGEVVHWNRGASALLGYSAPGAHGRPFAEFCAEQDQPRFLELEKLALSGKEASSDGLVFETAKEGSIILAISVSPVYVGGNLVGSACIGRDVTRRREFEDALRENDQVLRLEVERREQFLAMLSHELRNPMNAVSAATSVALHPEVDVQRRAAALGSIERQTAHLRRLLDDLLDVSRVTQNKLELKSQAFDLRSPMRAALEAAQAFADEKGVELMVELPAESVAFQGDPDRLQQLASNLLSNAVKFADPDNGRVRFSVALEGKQVLLSCRDNGAGVPAAVRDSIFNLFVQSDRTLERSGGGMGLGLTLVRAIARLHGGTVELRPVSETSGALFVVRLPLEAAAPQRARSTEGPSASSLSVLIVEDLADSRDALATILELDGHRVKTTGDGREALKIAEATVPDLVLCDIGLPGIDGYEVARRVRETPPLKRTKLIALTGYGTADDIAAAREAGFDEHLTKPLDAKRLNLTIARLFAR